MSILASSELRHNAHHEARLPARRSGGDAAPQGGVRLTLTASHTPSYAAASAQQRQMRVAAEAANYSTKLILTLILLNSIIVIVGLILLRNTWVAMHPSEISEDGGERPAWLAALNSEDLQFLKRFLNASGSLKDLGQEYQVSYPTVRGRLDRLIAKVRAAEDPKITDTFERKLQMLVADGALSHALAREILQAHRESRRGRS
jgi:hypothetical protein